MDFIYASRVDIFDIDSNEYPSRPRNKKNADLFKDSGLIEKYGSGIKRILQACAKAGLPAPIFEEVAQGFQVTFLMPERNVVENVVENGSEREKHILSLIRENNRLSAAAIGKLLQASPGTVQRDLTKLQLDGILVHQCPDRGGWWELMRS